VTAFPVQSALEDAADEAWELIKRVSQSHSGSTPLVNRSRPASSSSQFVFPDMNGAAGSVGAGPPLSADRSLFRGQTSSKERNELAISLRPNLHVNSTISTPPQSGLPSPYDGSGRRLPAQSPTQQSPFSARR
jgi:hypothetical protein